jgi:hypothetical protein
MPWACLWRGGAFSVCSIISQSLNAHDNGQSQCMPEPFLGFLETATSTCSWQHADWAVPRARELRVRLGCVNARAIEWWRRGSAPRRRDRCPRRRPSGPTGPSTSPTRMPRHKYNVASSATAELAPDEARRSSGGRLTSTVTSKVSINGVPLFTHRSALDGSSDALAVECDTLPAISSTRPDADSRSCNSRASSGAGALERRRRRYLAPLVLPRWPLSACCVSSAASYTSHTPSKEADGARVRESRVSESCASSKEADGSWVREGGNGVACTPGCCGGGGACAFGGGARRSLSDAWLSCNSSRSTLTCHACAYVVRRERVRRERAGLTAHVRATAQWSMLQMVARAATGQ